MIEYVTLDQAAKRPGISVGMLSRAIESGTIDAIQVDGSIAIPEDAMDVLLDEDLIGVPIRLMEAEEKYGINNPTLSRWADAGYIRTMERANKLHVLDEATVKRAATIYKHGLESTGSPQKAGWILRRFFNP